MFIKGSDHVPHLKKNLIVILVLWVLGLGERLFSELLFPPGVSYRVLIERPVRLTGGADWDDRFGGRGENMGPVLRPRSHPFFWSLSLSRTR